MEENRSENPQDQGDNQDKETRRRPRGLGGIVLILLLLLALFAMVSQANMDQKFSICATYLKRESGLQDKEQLAEKLRTYIKPQMAASSRS